MIWGIMILYDIEEIYNFEIKYFRLLGFIISLSHLSIKTAFIFLLI